MFLEMGIAELLVIVIALLLFIVGKKLFRAKWIVKNIEPGEKAVTAYGITGTLVTKGDKYCTLEIAPGVQVEIKNTKIAWKVKQAAPHAPPAQQPQAQTPPSAPTRQAPPPPMQPGVCSKCQAQNKPGDRFCEQCGAPLG